jgi:predicted GIY-YIG superfamily endonuclease
MCMLLNMYYVYILRSVNFDQTYVGFTKDLKKRFTDHNYGRSRHTKKFKPWRIVTYIAFDEECRARSFEKYIKTGSGIAFTKKHLS